MDPLQELLEQVDQLPTLPDMLFRIEAELNKPECDLRQVSEMIALDPVMTGHLLRMANSAIFGGGARMTSTLGAITRLGIRETRNLVVTSAVIHVLPSGDSNFNLRDFWTLGLASAICARQISRDLRCSVSDEAYLGGLVHCLGEAVLAVYFPIRFHEALDRARSESIDLVQAVWAEFGFTHPVLACKVLERWNFPGPVVEAVEYQLAPEAAPQEGLLASILLASDRICRELGFASFQPPEAERSWVAEIPGEFTSLLLETGFPDLDTYVTEQKDHLKEVGTLVSSLFAHS